MLGSLKTSELLSILRDLDATVILSAKIYRHSYSQIRILSLPVSQSLAIITLVLPLVIALSTRAAYSLPCTYSAQARPLLYLAIFIIQLICETIIATLSLTYMGPNCRLEEQWARLYRNKDGNAIRRIQDRFECCGFNTAVDRAWPFPHGRPEDGYGADQCERMYGRDMPCVGPWRQAAQINAGLLFTVVMVVFVVKACNLSTVIRKALIVRHGTLLLYPTITPLTVR